MRPLRRTGTVLLLVLGGLAVMSAIGPSWRRGVADATSTFYVTTSEDGGPGSLRSAIFAADRASGRARIVLRTPRIELSAPLPPLANPDGIDLESETGSTELVAVDWGSAPVLDIATGPSRVRGVIVRDAPTEGILARADRLRLEQVELLDCATGVHVSEGVDGFVLEDSRLIGNQTGVRLESPGVGHSIESSHFERNQTALVAIATGSRGLADFRRSKLIVRDNRFEEDARSIVLSRVTAIVERNHFTRIGETAIHVAGGSSTVSSNTILDGLHTAILLEASVGTSVVNNELARNVAIGLHLRSARNTSARSNRIYGNGYGITTMYDSGGSPNLISENLLVGQRYDGIVVIAGAPIIRANRVLESGAAGIRLLDVASGPSSPRVARPLLADNSLSGNRPNGPVREVFGGGVPAPVEG